MDREYIVTLHKKEDLEQFYNEMQLTNFPLVAKRPLSRNTHYMMTDDQAEKLRQDPRVLAVEPKRKYKVSKHASYRRQDKMIDGEFWKVAEGGGNTLTYPADDTLRQWGQLQSAWPGSPSSFALQDWGWGSNNSRVTTSNINIYGNGEDVDIVICDDTITIDNPEMNFDDDHGRYLLDPTNNNRVQNYQWFTQLDSVVTGLGDLDGETLPASANINYPSQALIPDEEYHGVHVASTAAGKFYGWASASMVYNMAVTSSWLDGSKIDSPYLIMDYLRAFHQSKSDAVYIEDGAQRATISNHSYGLSFTKEDESLIVIGDVGSIWYRGAFYDASNPGPSGWNAMGIYTDFGLQISRLQYGTNIEVNSIPAWDPGWVADIQDAIEDGVVIVTAAGNENQFIAEPSLAIDADWNNYVTITGIGTVYYMRGGWPANPDSGAIIVGSLSVNKDRERATYSNYGPGVDLFAPGSYILGSFTNIVGTQGSPTGIPDSKYPDDYQTSSGAYYYPISGTSMAAPQVTGALAIDASGKSYYNQSDARRYLDATSAYDSMTWDQGKLYLNSTVNYVTPGSYVDGTSKKDSPDKYLRVLPSKESTGHTTPSLKGNRKVVGLTAPFGPSPVGMTFPRRSISHRPPVRKRQVYEYTVRVTNGGSGNQYHFVGANRFLSANDNPIGSTPFVFTLGDSAQFTLDSTVSGHPFLIKSVAGTGTSNALGVEEVINNGADSGVITWNFQRAGRYYIECQYHSNMGGIILVT